jgi:hypothetical protein
VKANSARRRRTSNRLRLGPTIGQIFREYGPAYRAKHAERMTPEQLRVMGQLQRCRTGDLGHPHVHFIVPGGAISDDGQRWMPSRVNFFVPVKAASPIYRAKFLDCLAASGLADQARQALGDKPWVVHSKAVGDGQRPSAIWRPTSTAWPSATAGWSSANPAPTVWDVSRSPIARAAVAAGAP